MEYMSAAEASAKWGVSLRQVQRLLADNRIPHAQRYGRSWMIPRDAEKPIDPRKEKQSAQQSLSSDLANVLEAAAAPAPAKDPDAILNTVREEGVRLQFECALAYLRGDFARTMRCFHKTEGDDAAKLCACLVAVAAAVSLGDYQAYTEIDAYLKRFVKAGQGSDVAAIAEQALATAAVSMIAPNMAPGWLKDGDFSALPAPARSNALYLRAKYLQCIGQNEASLAVAQTALTLCAQEQTITMTEIYLRVTCAVACCTLGRTDEARRWLLQAMRICLPHGFITPFAELVTGLGGLVEQCLEQEFPSYHDAVFGQWKRTWKNWIAFHNQFTGDNITLMLSLREYHIAALVARRVPYAKIAKQYCISVGRLKNIVLEIYEKLFISSRDELAKYIIFNAGK